MLPQQYRLKNQKAFEATYRQRQVVSDTLLSLHIGKKKPENFSGATKIGFVVSKKLHKRATKRNRIKRLMREACRLELKNNGLKIKIHRIIHIENTWFLSCVALGFSQYDLRDPDFNEAVRKAKIIIDEKINEFREEFNKIANDDVIELE